MRALLNIFEHSFFANGLSVVIAILSLVSYPLWFNIWFKIVSEIRGYGNEKGNRFITRLFTIPTYAAMLLYAAYNYIHSIPSTKNHCETDSVRQYDGYNIASLTEIIEYCRSFDNYFTHDLLELRQKKQISQIHDCIDNMKCGDNKCLSNHDFLDTLQLDILESRQQSKIQSLKCSSGLGATSPLLPPIDEWAIPLETWERDGVKGDQLLLEQLRNADVSSSTMSKYDKEKIQAAQKILNASRSGTPVEALPLYIDIKIDPSDDEKIRPFILEEFGSYGFRLADNKKMSAVTLTMKSGGYTKSPDANNVEQFFNVRTTTVLTNARYSYGSQDDMYNSNPPDYSVDKGKDGFEPELKFCGNLHAGLVAADNFIKSISRKKLRQISLPQEKCSDIISVRLESAR